MDKQDENHDESQPETDEGMCVLHPSAPRLEEKVKWDEEDPLCAWVTWEGTPSEDEEVYKLYCWTDETDKREFEAHGRQYPLTKLKKGSMYFVNAIQINKAGCSVPSNIIKFETGPKMPINIQVMNYEPSPHDHLMVQFDNANTRQVDHLVSVQPISGSEIPLIETKKRQNFALIGGLTPGQFYSIQVAAIVGDLESDFANFPRKIQTYPGVPVDVKTEEFHDGVKLSWKHNEIRPKNYRIFWTANGDMQEVIETREDYFYFNKLKRSTIYKFRVAAINAAGESEKSAEIEYVTVPSAPINIKVTPNPLSKARSFIVKYDDPDTVLKKTYRIVANDIKGKEAATIETETHTAVLSELQPGQSYYIYVVAIYGTLESQKAHFIKK
ncbi:tenascin-N-like [Styela clava]